MIHRAIKAARNLLDAHLPVSADRLLTAAKGWGGEFNTLHQEVKQRRLNSKMKPGIYCLTTTSITAENSRNRIGLVVPVSAHEGDKHYSNIDDKAHKACENAWQTSISTVESGNASLPMLHLKVPESLHLEGDSVGLAAALAFVSEYCSIQPSTPVIATGAISPNGKISTVRGISKKLAAAHEELTGTAGTILVPAEDMSSVPAGVAAVPVKSLEEALVEIWGSSDPPAHRKFLSVDAVITRAVSRQSHREAIAILDGLLKEGKLADADRAVVLQHKGASLRHIGRTRESAVLFDEMESLYPAVERIHGPSKVETMRVEHLATAMDHYEFERQEEDLKALLESRFHLVHNKVRCQGMLAQVCSILEKHDEAMSLRKDNLELQQGSDLMQRERPHTLSKLIYEGARAGFNHIFDEHGRMLLQESPPGDPVQTRYNNNAIVRGLLLLKKHDFLWDWLDGRENLGGQEPGWLLLDLLNGRGPIEGHPDTSTARALMRLLRLHGRPDDALKLGDRIQIITPDEPLLFWISTLKDIEYSLALMDLDRSAEAKDLFSNTKIVLKNIHPEAYDYHMRYIDKIELNPVLAQEVERHLDEVYY